MDKGNLIANNADSLFMAEVYFIGSVTSISDEDATINIFEKYCPGLLGIEEYSHLIILFWLHERDDEAHRGTLQVYPRRHGETTLRGVYACRSPSRPNPIGLTVVELLAVDKCNLKVKGLDALVGSPVIDIKPYSTRSDCYPGAYTPDWSQRGSPS